MERGAAGRAVLAVRTAALKVALLLILGVLTAGCLLDPPQGRVLAAWERYAP